MKHVAKSGTPFYNVELSYRKNIVIVREAIEVDMFGLSYEML